MYEDDFLTNLTQDHSMGDHSAAQESTALQTLTKENHVLREQYATLLHEIRMRDEEIRRLAQVPGVTVPLPMMADSYKAGHYLMYPDALLMSAYGEFRKPMFPSTGDTRFVFCGMDHIIKTYLNRQWTLADLEHAEQFYATHNAGFTKYDFPKDLFQDFINQGTGYFPVKIEALPEGTVANIHTPVFIITAHDKYSRLCTFLETVLTMVWYPTTVATLSRFAKELIRKSFHETVDDVDVLQDLLDYKLHDFGFRACTCGEQSIIGGKAHLLNFKGSDTMSACWHAQNYDNLGLPVATSVPATEHSVMTSWPSEYEAMSNLFKVYGKDAIISCVMDSYNYDEALRNLLPVVKRWMDANPDCKCMFVIRPDSGDPVQQVLKGLHAADNCFGSDINSKGYKVLRRSAVIQGDGINIHTIKAILDAAKQNGFSALNIVFGMGGGLLQKVDRDTMSFATKLSYIAYADQEKFGTHKDVMKMPASDPTKFSLPGLLHVARDPNNFNQVTVYPAEDPYGKRKPSIMETVYDHGPVARLSTATFDNIRARVEKEWHQTRADHNPVSQALRAKIMAINPQAAV